MADHPFVNDPMTEHATGAGQWGLPSQPDTETPAEVAPSSFDYSAGIFVGTHDNEADAVPAGLHPTLIQGTTDIPLKNFEIPHEATHRRFEPPFIVPINQSAAGFTLIAAPVMGLHYVKLIGMLVTLDAAGTLQFVQGDSAGNTRSAISGTMNIDTNGGFVLHPADLANPWLFTSPDQALGIVTATGKAQGWAVCCYSAFDN